MTSAPWPGFRHGGLLLPLPSSWFEPVAPLLDWHDVRLQAKTEFHLTLLNRSTGARLRDAIGDDAVRRLFEAEDWRPARTGDGVLLRKHKPRGRVRVACASLVELVDLPAMQRFRSRLGQAAGVVLPEAPAHVTLYTAGDPAGIGLPNPQALADRAVSRFRLPGIGNRPAPALAPEMAAAHRAAEYRVASPAACVRIGQPAPAIDAELERRGMERATLATAHNPFSAAADGDGNQLRGQWLREVVRREGLAAVDAEGRDPAGQWPAEAGLLVFGTTPALDDRLLRDFEQHAVVVLEASRPARLVLHPDAR